MKLKQVWMNTGISALSFALFLGAMPLIAQVGPAEISDPRLKTLEQSYLREFVDMNRAISVLKFPFVFKLSRYAALDPEQQIGADARGLEFVSFHDKVVLKITGNYNAAYNTEMLTSNERVNRVFDEVIVPILRLLAGRLGEKPAFDAVGFEVAYHTRRYSHGFDFEGKEILAVVMDRADACSYPGIEDPMKRQGVLNRAEVFLNGKPFGLALGARDPLDVASLLRSVRAISSDHSPAPETPRVDNQSVQDTRIQPAVLQESLLQPPASTLATSPAEREKEDSAVNRESLPGLERKYQTALESLAKQGAAKFHFVDYAPPSFVSVRNQTALQVTLRNPDRYDKDATSIYKRAAQAFDLFFAPELKPILDLIPDRAEFEAFDVTILNELDSKDGKSSEALEFIFPSIALRRFAAAEITNQELVNQSIVLVNGVRVALNLQQVE